MVLRKPRNRKPSEIERISEELLCYIEANPNAKDTREGIARWWIARQRIASALEAVDAAIALLIARGLVSESTLADGTRVYGRSERSRTQPRTAND